MTRLWPHQTAAADLLEPKGSGMLALDMGSGKTLTTLELLRRWQCRRVLVLAPKSVVRVWPQEFRKHLGSDWWVEPLDSGSTQQRAQRLLSGFICAGVDQRPYCAVMNYEATIHGVMPSTLSSLQWDALVLDESHRCKQPTGKQSRLVGQLATEIPHVLGLTGTPMPHSPLDIWAQFRAIAPAVLPRSFWAFRNRYAVMGGYQGKQVTGYQNLPDLQARLAPYTYRVRTDDVLTLPDAVDEHRYCLLAPRAQRVYHDLEQDLVARIGDGVVTASNALTLLLRLAQVANGFVSDADTGALRQVGTEKADLLRDLLEDLPAEEPLVVFGRFVEDLETIGRVTRATGRTCAELSGRCNDLARWQEGGADVLAVQLRAGGLGVDFTRARIQVYFALDYSLGDYLQTRARIRRPGQSRSVTYVHLLAAGTVDEKVATALAARQEVVGAVVDGLRRTQPQEVTA